MPTQTWTTPDQTEFLQSLLPEFQAAQRRKNTSAFWVKTFREFFALWKGPEDEIMPMVVPNKKKKRARANLPKPVLDHASWVTLRQAQITTWYNNRGIGTINRKTGPAIVIGASNNQRTLSELNLYSKKYYLDRVRPNVLRMLAEDETASRISVIGKCTAEAWKNESEEIKQEIHAEYVHLKELKMLPPVEPESRTPEEYAIATAALPAIAKSFLEEMATRTGWSFTLLAGGPENGKMRTVAYHQGLDKYQQIFSSANPRFYEDVLTSFRKFLYNVYDLEEIDKRGFGKLSDNAAAGSDTGKEIIIESGRKEDQPTGTTDDLTKVTPVVPEKDVGTSHPIKQPTISDRIAQPSEGVVHAPSVDQPQKIQMPPILPPVLPSSEHGNLVATGSATGGAGDFSSDEFFLSMYGNMSLDPEVFKARQQRDANMPDDDRGAGINGQWDWLNDIDWAAISALPLGTQPGLPAVTQSALAQLGGPRNVSYLPPPPQTTLSTSVTMDHPVNIGSALPIPSSNSETSTGAVAAHVPLASVSIATVDGAPTIGPTHATTLVQPDLSELLAEDTGSRRSRKAAASKETAPPLAWLTLALGYLNDNEVDDKNWRECVKAWEEFERKEASEQDTSSLRFPAALRPEPLSKWLKSRNYGSIPVVDDAFGDHWIKWWGSIQPDWRRSKEGLPLPFDSAKAKDSVLALRKGGPSGLVTVMIGLKLWAKKRSTDSRWTSAVDDVRAAFGMFEAASVSGIKRKKGGEGKENSKKPKRG